VRRSWTIAVASFAVLTTGLVGFAIHTSRQATLSAVEERTRSVAHMIAAHGEASIGDAATVITAVEERVADWDLSDPDVGRQLFDALRNLILAGPHISSAWIVDAAGDSRLDTWSFPPRASNAAQRRYFQRHVEDPSEGDVLAGAETGTITGRDRFTVSRAVRNPDGSLHAVIVVGILSDQFDTLYAEAATWPAARAGLYTLDGDVLARLTTVPRAPPDFIRQMEGLVQSSPSGSAVINDGERRLASWRRSQTYRDVYATSSQTITTALAEWRRASATLAGIGLAAVLGFGLLAVASVRAAEARDAARLRGLAIREVHHRVKNALQLIISMTALRSRQTDDAAAKAELHHIASLVRALAAIEDMLQNTSQQGNVELGALLRTLCDRLRPAFGGELRFAGQGTLTVPASTATSIAIILNELLLNAIKYAGALIEVTWHADDGRLTLTVCDDGPGLPAGFDKRRADGSGFGLIAARSMARSLGATLAADSGPTGGARFRLDVPVSASRSMPDTPSPSALPA
jgi:two-component sensor histidine kinase